MPLRSIDQDQIIADHLASPPSKALPHLPENVKIISEIALKIIKDPELLFRILRELYENNRSRQIMRQFSIKELWHFVQARLGMDKVSWSHLLRLIKNEMDVAEYRLLTYIEITNCCNLRCKGCYIDHSANTSEPFMSEDKLRTIISTTAPQSKMTLIMGGEPLQPGSIDMLDRVLADFPDYNFSIVTNGGYIAKNGLGVLGRHDHVIWVVSIDGDEKHHNSVRRGKLYWDNPHKQFGEVMKTIGILKQHKRYIGASIVIRESTFPCITSESFQQMLQETGVTGCTYIRARECQDELSEENFELARQRIHTLSRRMKIVSPAFSAPGLPGPGDDQYVIYAPDGQSRFNRVTPILPTHTS